MDDSTQSILMNKEVIAVDQDWGGRQGYRLRDDGTLEVWLKPMSDGGRALVLLNRGTSDANFYRPRRTEERPLRGGTSSALVADAACDPWKPPRRGWGREVPPPTVPDHGG